MLLCKYGEVYSLLQFCPCSHCSPAPVIPDYPTTTPPLDTLFTTSQMFPVAPNHCHSPSLLSFHPWTTPWAVAHEAGGRWCAIHHCHRGMVSWLGFSILKKENPSCCEQDGGEQGVVSLWASGPATLHKQGPMAVVGVNQGAPTIIIINSKITI